MFRHDLERKSLEGIGYSGSVAAFDQLIFMLLKTEPGYETAHNSCAIRNNTPQLQTTELYLLTYIFFQIYCYTIAKCLDIFIKVIYFYILTSIFNWFTQLNTQIVTREWVDSITCLHLVTL